MQVQQSLNKIIIFYTNQQVRTEFELSNKI